jgi:pimeloyl-ACP methyl ester carboxylesterase
MNPNRRTFLVLAGTVAASHLGRSQYVLPPQAVPPERYPPSPAQSVEIGRKMALMQERLADLRKKNVPDESLVEAEIFHKAAVWIGRYDEYFAKDAADQTLALLDLGLARAAELDAGKSSWKSASGRVIRAYRSRVDGGAQPYIATVPGSTIGGKPGRMDVLLHGTNRRMVEVQFLSHTQITNDEPQPVPAPDFLQIEVLGRTNNAYRWAGETDVFEAIEAARRSYPVDENRITLRGFSMGGSGTWHLGLQHPDVWAAIEPGAGFNDTMRYGRMPNLPPHELKTLHIYDSKDYALNMFQLPTAAYTGEDDGQLPNLAIIREELAKSDIMFQRDGLDWVTKGVPMIMIVGPKTGHRWEPESRKRTNAFMNDAAKKGRVEPDHIRFVTYTTRYNRCFWVTVDGLDRHYERAEVDALRSKAGATIEVKTKNVSALMLNASGIKSVKIDGHDFASSGSAGLRFHKRGGIWTEGENQALRKRHGLQGPIDDAFFEPFLCVRPTGQGSNDLAGRYAQETLDAFVDDYGKYFRGQVPVKNDTEVTPEDIADRHLVLFGDAESNQLLRRVVDKLPLRWDARQLSFSGKIFDATNHTIAMVYPNPLQPRRYVVLNSGHSFRRTEMAATNATLFPRFGDFAVIHLRQAIGRPVEGEVLTAGYFDEEWKLPRA